MGNLSLIRSGFCSFALFAPLAPTPSGCVTHDCAKNIVLAVGGISGVFPRSLIYVLNRASSLERGQRLPILATTRLPSLARKCRRTNPDIDRHHGGGQLPP
eukprot:4694456-Pleurochrysis_carterae.AAC.1